MSGSGSGSGSGPGPIAADGCAVEVYAALMAHGEPELIDGVLRRPSSILDLGAGAGRIADPLAERGHRVVAIDECAEMLALLRFAEPVRSRIESLRLVEVFDAVLLTSHLLNTAIALQRQGFLRAAARHVRAGGVVFIEWHPPEWFAGLTPGTVLSGRLDGFDSELHVQGLTLTELTATVVYRNTSGSWSQSFIAARLTDGDLSAQLSAVGLVLDRYLSADRRWLLARKP